MGQYIRSGAEVMGPKASANEFAAQPKPGFDSGAELANQGYAGRNGATRLYGRVAEVEAPAKPKETPSKPKEDDDLDERVRRIIREIPGPTPQPGGE